MTSFRFGARSVPGQHAGSPGRAHGIIPSNAGIAHAAQDRIDLLTSAASRRIAEAISIDAVQLFVFSSKRHGIQCGCETVPSEHVEPQTPINPYVLGESEDKTDDLDATGSKLRVRVRDVSADDHHRAMQRSYRPDHNYSEADIFDEEPIPPATSTTGSTDPYVEDSLSTGPYEGPMHDGRHAGEYDHETSDTTSDEYGEELISQYDTEPWNVDSILNDNAYVIGSSQTCPICFGTGLLGGYDLLGGTRLILSSVNATNAPVLGPDVSVSPPAYNLAPGEYVEWGGLNCPNYFKFAWASSYDGRHNSEVTIRYTLDNGTTWKAIAQLENDNQVNLTALIIRATNETTHDVGLTHVDVTLIHNVVRGQLTNFNQTAGHDRAIRGDGLEISFPPELGKVDRNALVAENKHRLMWRVTTVTPVETAKGQVISCSAATELMEPTLTETMLFPLYSVKGNKQLIYGTGVEPVQGLR
jgi:hypothetical protein